MTDQRVISKGATALVRVTGLTALMTLSLSLTAMLNAQVPVPDSELLMSRNNMYNQTVYRNAVPREAQARCCSASGDLNR